MDPSLSGLYLPRVCNICSSFHSRHEWTHISEWAVSASSVQYIYVLVFTLGMSGPISEWAVSASSVQYIYVLVFTLGMSGPISEWAVSASSVQYMF